VTRSTSSDDRDEQIRFARTEYLDRLEWNRKRLSKEGIAFEEFDRDMFYELERPLPELRKQNEVSRKSEVHPGDHY